MTPPFLIVRLVVRIASFRAIGSALAINHRLRNRWRTFRARRWPSVTATVHTADVCPMPNGPYYRVTLTYSYFVDEFRAGEYRCAFRGEDAACHFARIMKHSELSARYNPTQPDVSTLDARTLNRRERQAIHHAKLAAKN